MDIVIYPCWDLSLSVFAKGTPCGTWAVSFFATTWGLGLIGCKTISDTYWWKVIHHYVSSQWVVSMLNAHIVFSREPFLDICNVPMQKILLDVAIDTWIINKMKKDITACHFRWPSATFADTAWNTSMTQHYCLPWNDWQKMMNNQRCQPTHAHEE